MKPYVEISYAPAGFNVNVGNKTDIKCASIGDKILIKNGASYFEGVVQDMADNNKAIKLNGSWYNIGPDGCYKFIEIIKPC